MFEIIKAILFGIVEGITEWLPVSSTGHLILLDEFLKLDVSPEFYEMFQVVIQLGAIAAVIVLFFHQLNPFAPSKDHKQKKRTWILWSKVVVAVLPSAVLGFLFDDILDTYLYNAWVVAAMLIIYGIAFIYVEKRNQGKSPKIKNCNEIDFRTAIIIGAFQCLSLIPGTSRSGSTILGAILIGVSRTAASEFSFFLAIPTMLGASGLKLLGYVKDAAELGLTTTSTEVSVLIVGCVVSFLVSLLVIKKLMKYVKNHSFATFGNYRIVLGALVLASFLLFKLLPMYS